VVNKKLGFVDGHDGAGFNFYIGARFSFFNPLIFFSRQRQDVRCKLAKMEGLKNVDEDGDLIVERRSGLQNSRHPEDLFLSELHQDIILDKERIKSEVDETITEYDFEGSSLSIRHRMATPLGKVGLQVWKGAVLLSEYILHGRDVSLKDAVVLELGAGCGLVGLVAARAGARKVYCTDIGHDVLLNCQKNVEHNNLRGTVTVRRLDWAAIDEESFHPTLTIRGNFGWTPGEFDELCKTVNVILAADVVYDDALTTALMRTCLSVLLRASKGTYVLLALERRDCFTVQDMQVRAPAYDYWRSLFQSTEPIVPDGFRWSKDNEQRTTDNHLVMGWGMALVGHRVDFGSQGNLQIWRLHAERKP
jgi:predicted nicotinamide N-methyase